MIDPTAMMAIAMTDFMPGTSHPVLTFSDGDDEVTAMLTTKDRLNLIQLSDRDMVKLYVFHGPLVTGGDIHTFEVYGYPDPLYEVTIWAVHIGSSAPAEGGET